MAYPSNEGIRTIERASLEELMAALAAIAMLSLLLIILTRVFKLPGKNDLNRLEGVLRTINTTLSRIEGLLGGYLMASGMSFSRLPDYLKALIGVYHTYFPSSNSSDSGEEEKRRLLKKMEEKKLKEDEARKLHELLKKQEEEARKRGDWVGVVIILLLIGAVLAFLAALARESSYEA